MTRLLATITMILAAVAAVAGNAAMRMWYDRPAAFFEESLPLGNGKTGALVYGDPDREVVFLNDITLWTGKPVDRSEGAGASRWIPEIRKALFNEDYELAEKLQHNVQGHNSEFFQPLATLFITDRNSGDAVEYRRELDIDNAVARVEYRRGGVRYEREYFASHPDKVIAIRLSASQGRAINCDIALTSQVPHRAKASRGTITMTGHAIGDESNSIHFCSQLIVRNKGGRIEAADSTLRLDGVDEAVIYFVNETSFNGFDRHPVTEGAPYIENVSDDAWHLVNYTYEELKKRHTDDYRSFFGRLSLQLGDGTEAEDARPTDVQLKDYTDKGEKNTHLETLYFQYGRYLLISCSRTPGVPANLQGLWTPHKWSPWRGNYTVNINLEENYWPAEVANLTEMAMPLDGFVSALAQNGSHAARNYYGINQGWCSSHNSDIWAMANPVGENREEPMWANWNMGGAWLVNTLWEHYDFTQDRDYLASTAYPLMKGAADFALAWLTENPHRKGELITAPCTSPEAQYITDKGFRGATFYGGAADMAIIRELLTNTLAAAKITGEGKKYRATLAETIARLRPYSIGRRGNIMEWYHDWDDQDQWHRHQSHLIGLYPGHQITAGTPLLAEAAAKTLELKGDNTTGWSTGWRINLWARLHNGRQAYRIYRKLLTYVSPDGYEGEDKRHSGGTYPNLFDAHPPFQIDGNFGGTAGVCEMLVQSGGGNITLLPAVPDEWKDGKARGLRARGGFEVSMEWRDGKVVAAEISGRHGGKITVTYNGKTEKAKIKAGRPWNIKE